MEYSTHCGIKCYDFGVSNYSHDMRAVIFNPKDITLKKVITLPGVFLHPIAEPNSLEIFTVIGTQQQFNKFYQAAVESYAIKAAIDRYGMPDTDDEEMWKLIASYKDQELKSFVPWYEKLEE